ncbi:hypothetical protein [Deinococcus cellulosilyticus]|uniref:Uncharacterized protein n=1 Tax=Deinococcus cellulosilyticus (strain DSM 18568 / NBRC 106333 / KACC 11606 / 5516J-15) TaxID=1223518 RepID=A0A511NAI9_DEIC1|nr:hypothetical protein [Deinococcus cellulosilyticus]GEM49842.1 hypothetical protein DC3_54770 [Deinococcus cellulosilyticus NBRC 106333 = KACC 11606]
MVEIRLMGTPEDVEMLARELGKIVEVLEVSGNHPNRGASLLVRKYLKVNLIPAQEEVIPLDGDFSTLSEI